MACGHKFAKLKPANHQKIAIRQNLAPPNLPAIWYLTDIARVYKIHEYLHVHEFSGSSR